MECDKAMAARIRGLLLLETCVVDHQSVENERKLQGVTLHSWVRSRSMLHIQPPHHRSANYVDHTVIGDLNRPAQPVRAVQNGDETALRQDYDVCPATGVDNFTLQICPCWLPRLCRSLS